jgi:Sensors of blue-light using FAD
MAFPMPADLVSLVYFSHARRRFDEAALLALLRVARANNARDGITGMLLYHDGNFIQALEGPRAAVERTFARIRANEAHDGVVATSVMPIDARQFAEWSMGFLASSALSAEEKRSVNDFLRKPAGETIGHSVAWSMLATFRNGIARAA